MNYVNNKKNLKQQNYISHNAALAINDSQIKVC